MPRFGSGTHICSHVSPAVKRHRAHVSMECGELGELAERLLMSPLKSTCRPGVQEGTERGSPTAMRAEVAAESAYAAQTLGAPSGVTKQLPHQERPRLGMSPDLTGASQTTESTLRSRSHAMLSPAFVVFDGWRRHCWRVV